MPRLQRPGPDWRKPWLNEDGSTDVDGFLRAYAIDNNTFWRCDQGHIMNVLDELIDRLDSYPSVTHDDGEP
jgi:hypothetical protein